MIPMMLLAGTASGLLAVGGLPPRSVAAILVACALVWGVLVGIDASSWLVGAGGAALGAVNAAVAAAVVWAISSPVRRRNGSDHPSVRD